MKSLALFILLLSVSSLGAQTRTPAPEDSIRPLLKLSEGSIRGFHNDRTGVSAYKGIPFAAAPVGDLRWRPPQPLKSWEGIKDCTQFSASPMQPKPVPFLFLGPEFVVPQTPLSEDCLYLNVWTAAKSSREKRPVLVWIYGGGFMTGGAAAPGYSGEALAQQGIVFVSFNYRLGVFGFLAHPALTAESPHHSSGNYALMDQIAALEWVRKNISAFGGDPDRITIAGQSAGSASVNCLLASPLARNLIQGAIGESGSLVLENPLLRMRSLHEAEQDGSRLASKFSDSSIAGMRALSAEEIQKKGGGFFSPIVDGYVEPVSVADCYKKNQQLHVPLITGWNGDEGILFGIVPKENFARQAADFGSDSNLFKKYYPSLTDTESVQSQIALSRDKTMGVPGYVWALLQNDQSNAKTFIYRFNRKPPAMGDKKRFGAYHTAEIGYALHNLDSIQRAWEPVDRDLEKIMSAYWVQFVKTGNPNGAQLPVWNSFSKDKPFCMFFDDKVTGMNLPDQHALDFLYARYPGK